FSPTGRTWRPRSTWAVFGYWKPQIWTRRYRGGARPLKRAARQSRCERFSRSRPPQTTEQCGNSELVLRSGVFEAGLATDLNQRRNTTERRRAPHGTRFKAAKTRFRYILRRPFAAGVLSGYSCLT